MDIFPYDAVVFDLDGTLFDAQEAIVSSVRRAMDEMGLEVPAGRWTCARWWARRWRIPSGTCWACPRRAFRRPWTATAAIPARGACTYYSVYPNIRSILRMLHEAGVPVGLAASKHASAGEGRPVLLRAGRRF